MSPSYLFTVPFQTSQPQLNQSLFLLADRTLLNFTYPDCRTYDTIENGYLPCQGCNVSTYTNDNVTFICSKLSQLCASTSSAVTPPSSRQRLLTVYTDDYSSSVAQDDYFTSDQTVTLQQYSAILVDSAYAFLAVITVNPFSVNIGEAVAVLSFLGSLAAALIIGSLYLFRLDALEKDEVLEKHHWPPVVSVQRVLQSYQKEIAACPSFFFSRTASDSASVDVDVNDEYDGGK
jgi:hypothetical protein